MGQEILQRQEPWVHPAITLPNLRILGNVNAAITLIRPVTGPDLGDLARGSRERGGVALACPGVD